MNKLVKKYLVLFFAIIIPLLAAFLVGSYGYNSEKFGKGEWLEKFTIDYLTPESSSITTEQRIFNHMTFGVNNQYYAFDKKPFVEKEIFNDENRKLFDLLVYQAVYKFQEEDKFQYILFFHNIQYQNIRDMFPGDEHLRSQINSANVPTLSVRFHEVLEDKHIDPKSIPVVDISETSFSLLDKGADYKTKTGRKEDDIQQGDEFVKVKAAMSVFTSNYNTNVFELRVEAEIPSISGDAGKTSIAKIELNLDHSLEGKDISGFVSSHKMYIGDVPGYFGWVFRNYLWWICLTAFALVGLVTGSFYIVYMAEERRVMDETKKIKKKRN